MRSFPQAVRRDIGKALYAAQHGETDPAAKPLKGFGGTSVMEIVAPHAGDTWRAVYTVRFRDALYVLHSVLSARPLSAVLLSERPHLAALRPDNEETSPSKLGFAVEEEYRPAWSEIRGILKGRQQPSWRFHAGARPAAGRVFVAETALAALAASQKRRRVLALGSVLRRSWPKRKPEKKPES